MPEARRPQASRPDVAGWFAAHGWRPFAFQRQVWRAMADGRSGLLHATTGSGKTYAVWLGALQALAAQYKPKRPAALAKQAPAATEKEAKQPAAEPLTVLWITPMRALAVDTLKALAEPLAELAPAHPPLARWTLAARTGDTASGERSAQARRLPTVLVTTPESLSLLLARADAHEQLSRVRLVVADEWHELLGTKRGVQLQLALARLATWNPSLMAWGMSATLGNLPEAMDTLLAPLALAQGGVLVQGRVDKTLVVDTLLPDAPERFSWAGHLGLRMLPAVVAELAASSTTLVFVNVRSQAEQWYQALLDARPDWAGQIAIHHGSLDRAVREWVEAGLKNGSLRAVVATSSLDLGVDFAPVERVLQIGSAKGVARLLQRAGRSGHSPGRPSRITLVPTHSLEIVEAAAARAAVRAAQVESRSSPVQPVDVLVQHLVTVALGGGFTPEALYAEVRRTWAYRELPRAVWDWCLAFAGGGGRALAAYPDYRRVVPDEDGIWRVPEARLARRHRANIGTIVSDASMSVQILHGARLGSMEESFLSRLSPGDCFVFAGQVLELVRIEQMTAYVRRAPRTRATVPRWAGSRMPLSTVLADFVVQQLAQAADGRYTSPELRAVRGLLQLQQRWSQLPTPATLLAEVLRTREGWHLFLYPFAGRHAHMGLASLLAWRAAQHEAGTFSIAVNDYGLELLSATPRDWAALLPCLLRAEPDPAAAPPQDAGEIAVRNTANAQNAPEEGSADPARRALLHEVLASLNATEMARRRFREIARVAGLIFQSHPGEQRSARQLQASAQLFFEVFRKYDSGNLLLRQASDEVLSQELDVAELLAALRRMQAQRLTVCALARPGPLAFPLMVERFREKLSNEALADRIARMLGDLEAAADTRGPAPPVRVQDVVPPDPPLRRSRRAAPAPAAPPDEAGGAPSIAAALDFGLSAAGESDTARPARAPRRRRPSRPLPRL
ncbi:MAG TPA: ligase-associated DNA damage response DEXH box helicase [Comamonadaceae bacterium]|uniref:ligase-associated DNA damage response DEXH box helicase n=1 Tax=Pulveribacter sp. TaxID=2678893 RepID=UPI000EE84A50|nr:ligase-associated DNA damage response DEXH box helicase [Pulveribacter sp.]HCL87552.1 ligase-associated DNA damage response DEXH box helicase [Comamonadaceae bacterium]